ncbi:cytochrome P450 [Hypomontagnella monticulosa]|nr:cytochrome P450 [Hypomontagnella monticulosa]
MSHQVLTSFPLTPSQVSLTAAALLVLYGLSLSIYRLFFHPLRQIPGPKLAALTQWVETYYDCFKPPGGQFMWEYQKWHQKYGPIVRVGPNEVHIQDVTFYDTLYSNSRHSDKLKQLENRFGNRNAMLMTADHDIHRMRRVAINPFFSKRKISQYSSKIQAHMDRLCKRVSAEFLANGRVLTLNNMWAAFTADIIVGYTLEKSYDFILKPNFRAEFSDAIVGLIGPVHFITHFPWMLKVSELLPDKLIGILSPPMVSARSFFSEMKSQIQQAKQVHGKENTVSQQSLFTALLGSGLPPAELQTERLQHEALAVISAGFETTMYALSVCSYHILSNPEVISRLQTELVNAIPDPEAVPDLDTLMRLPYLTCVITEGLRFSYGLPQRLSRLSPTAMTYSTPQVDYHLPVGAIVSMDNYTASHDPWAFPDPYEYRPERWEGNPRAPDGKPLTSYLVAFGRGTRSCVGIQLAYANLYIGLATFYRRFDCALYETKRDAVDCYYDSFLPRPKPGTKGVRVQVLRSA